MRLIDISIKKPVFTTMMMAAIIVLGLYSYMNLGVELMPNTEFPYVIVQTVLPGASPEETETSLTKVIEESVNGISGLEDIIGYSYEGMSLVIGKFELEKNSDVAAQEVRDKVNAVLSQLPDGTQQPVIMKMEMDSMPIINVVVSGQRNLIDLTEFAKKKVKENVETIAGVGSATVVGGREREIHIVLNPMKMASLGISSSKVKQVLAEQNIEIPGGTVEQRDKFFTLRTLGRIGSVRDFRDIVVTTVNGTPIRISDIAKVEDTGETESTVSFLNGKPSVTVQIKKQSGSNTVAVAKKVRDRIAQLEPSFPADINVKIVNDQSEFINDSVNAVKEHLILGAVLAGLMVLVFMGDWRSTIISTLTIPVSLIGTFMVMDYFGFTFNNMTLLGLTIAVGLVIDDAIVMIENIYRNMEERRLAPKKAATIGANEIAFAVIAISISLIVIFVPMSYMDGIIGRFMKHYALTIAVAVAISTFVSLTLTPMMSSIFLKAKKSEKTKLQLMTDRLNDWLAHHYANMLEWSLSHRALMVVLSILILISTVPMSMIIGKDFMPTDDSGQYQINIKAPDGTSLEATKKLFEQIEKETRKIPFVVNTLTNIGSGSGADSLTSNSNQGTITVELTPLGTRPGLLTIMAYVRDMMAKYEGVRSSVVAAGGFGSGQKQLQFNIMGPDLDTLFVIADKVLEKIKKVPGVVDADLSSSKAKPEYRVEIDRNRAHDLGVKISDIASSLRTMVGGAESITKFKDGGELYEVRVRAENGYRNTKELIEAMIIPASKGTVRLDSVAKVVEGIGPTRIERTQRQRKVTVEANTDGVLSLGKLIDAANNAYAEVKQEMNLSAEYTGGLTGMSEQMGKMIKSFIVAFVMAFVFIYIVLASQFESFVYPLSILVALPLTLPFAFLSLLLLKQNITFFSIMGLFMLFGVVKKNAILQVETTNQLRQKGFARHDASIKANKMRLRPILMTTLTLIACMIPTALGQGAGSGSRRAMAWVIIGGQTLSLLITLLMTPVTYTLFDDLQAWAMKKLGIKDDRFPAEAMQAEEKEPAK
ncbi:MAG: efflux RND transporter permease subunit [Elusimicrobiales bacterium]|nr:efflux RND transporter permease subunit [Elusimicrobiales bacterium]